MHWTTEEGELTAIIKRLIDAVDMDAVTEHRVHAQQGANRKEALGANGAGPVLQLAEGNLEAQIDAHIRSCMESERSGPPEHIYFVLRKSKTPGNVIVGGSVRCGDRSSLTQGATIQHRALAQAVEVLPNLYRMMERITNRAMDDARISRKYEMKALLTMAHGMGRSEGGNSAAQWEALGAMAENLGPGVSDALMAWARSKGGSADPSKMTPDDVQEFLASLDPEVQAQVLKDILAAASE